MFIRRHGQITETDYCNPLKKNIRRKVMGQNRRMAKSDRIALDLIGALGIATQKMKKYQNRTSSAEYQTIQFQERQKCF